MKYAYLLIPGIVILLFPILKAAIDAHRENAENKRKIAEKERRESARREALREAKALREAEEAAKEAAKAAAAPKRGPGRPRKNPLPEQRPESISTATPKAAAKAAAPGSSAGPVASRADRSPVTYVGNNVFAGETVAFTGTLPGMTRREAIEAVKKNGGKASENMPASTTILVVGNRPGRCKLDNADKWIGSCRKITALEFSIMLSTPLTLTPKQFADYVHTLHDAA